MQSLRGKAREGHQETAWTMENTDILLSSTRACLLATMSQGSWYRMLGDEGQRGCPLKYRAEKILSGLTSRDTDGEGAGGRTEGDYHPEKT